MTKTSSNMINLCNHIRNKFPKADEEDIGDLANIILTHSRTTKEDLMNAVVLCWDKRFTQEDKHRCTKILSEQWRWSGSVEVRERINA